VFVARPAKKRLIPQLLAGRGGFQRDTEFAGAGEPGYVRGLVRAGVHRDRFAQDEKGSGGRVSTGTRPALIWRVKFARSRAAPVSSGAVIEVGTQPALNIGDGHPFSRRVIFNLVAADFSHRKIF
jgi:hypothetical protein